MFIYEVSGNEIKYSKALPAKSLCNRAVTKKPKTRYPMMITEVPTILFLNSGKEQNRGTFMMGKAIHIARLLYKLFR